MSHEATMSFLRKMKTDKAFRAKIMAVEDVIQRINLINSEGFDCTCEDFSTKINDHQQIYVSACDCRGNFGGCECHTCRGGTCYGGCTTY